MLLFALLAVVLLVVGIGVAVGSGLWPLAAVLLLALAGVAGFAFLSNRRYRHSEAGKAVSQINLEAAIPELQRQNLNLAVAELSRILDAGQEVVPDLQSAFIVAEDLALRQIQQEERVPIMRHVSVAGVPFDAVYLQGDVLVCGEVAFLVSPELKQERVLSMMRKIATVNKSISAANMGLRLRLLVILVTQMEEKDLQTLRSTLNTGRFSGTPVDIDIRLLDFEELQRLYVNE